LQHQDAFDFSVVNVMYASKRAASQAIIPARAFQPPHTLEVDHYTVHIWLLSIYL